MLYPIELSGHGGGSGSGPTIPPGAGTVKRLAFGGDHWKPAAKWVMGRSMFLTRALAGDDIRTWLTVRTLLRGGCGLSWSGFGYSPFRRSMAPAVMLMAVPLTLLLAMLMPVRLHYVFGPQLLQVQCHETLPLVPQQVV